MLELFERVVVKIDDDVVVNVFLLTYYVEYLLALDPSLSPNIHCYTFQHSRPTRWRNSKWFVSRQEYSAFKYPPYCAGAAFIMHASVLAMLGRAVHRVPFLWLEDVYATGLVARSAKVGLVDIARHCILWSKDGTVPIIKNTLFIHISQHKVLFERAQEYWKRIMMQNQTR